MRLCSGAVLLLEDRRTRSKLPKKPPLVEQARKSAACGKCDSLLKMRLGSSTRPIRPRKRARVYHRAAMRHLIQRDFLFFALVVAVFLGVLLYHAP
jgi:hypothetical protein